MKVIASNHRDFIALAVEIACATDKNEVRSLLRKALDKGTIAAPDGKKYSLDPRGKIEEISVIDYYADRADRIAEAVMKISEFLTNKTTDQPFWIARRPTFLTQSDKTYSDQTIKGWIRFYSDIGDGGPPDTESNEGVLLELEADDMVVTLIEQLLNYAKRRSIKFEEIPLLRCEYCDKPFIGVQPKQRFCTKLHGQKWHAREAHRKKKV